NGVFEIDQGGFATGTAFTYGSSGTLTFNNSTGSYGVNNDAYWPATNGPAIVNVSAARGITMNVARTVPNSFSTPAGVTNGNKLTSNGNSQINSGGFFTGAPTYGSASTLIYATGGAYGRGAEWSATTGAGYPANVTVTGVTTLDLGNGGTAVARQCAG